jgi:hypothetical protein
MARLVAHGAAVQFDHGSKSCDCAVTHGRNAARAVDDLTLAFRRVSPPTAPERPA